MKKYRKIRRRKHNKGKDSFFQKETEKQPDFFENKTNDPFFNSHPRVQTKLSIGQPGDKYEKQADTMADKVVNKAEEEEAQPKLQKQEEEEAQTKLQRQEEEEEMLQAQPLEEEEEMLQAQPLEEEEEMLQPKSETGGHQPQQGLSSKLSEQSGTGKKLPENTLNEMSNFFGVDFSPVDIHTGDKSEEMNSELHAQAFTHGKDIYFNKGKYNPDNKEGKHLLAHELTHVIQQKGSELKKKEVIQRNPGNSNDWPLDCKITLLAMSNTIHFANSKKYAKEAQAFMDIRSGGISAATKMFAWDKLKGIGEKPARHLNVDAWQQTLKHYNGKTQKDQIIYAFWKKVEAQMQKLHDHEYWEFGAVFPADDIYALNYMADKIKKNGNYPSEEKFLRGLAGSRPSWAKFKLAVKHDWWKNLKGIGEWPAKEMMWKADARHNVHYSGKKTLKAFWLNLWFQMTQIHKNEIVP